MVAADTAEQSARKTNTCCPLLVLFLRLNSRSIGRARAARLAASLSETIWGPDQCHLVLSLLHHTPLPKRPPSPMQTDSTLLLQTLWLFSVRRSSDYSAHFGVFLRIFEELFFFIISATGTWNFSAREPAHLSLRDFSHPIPCNPVVTVSKLGLFYSNWVQINDIYTRERLIYRCNRPARAVPYGAPCEVFF